jgi:voltage-gated potassium channel Kch
MDVREYVHHTMEDPSFSLGAFAVCMLINGLIVLSCAAFVAETLPAWEKMSFWWYAEYFFVAIFTVELFIRYWAFPGTTEEFVSDPLNIIDVLAVAPFYVVLATDLSLHETRFLRVVRLVRIFKIGRYYAPLMLILTTFVRASGALLLCLFFIVSGLVFFSSILWYLERGVWDVERGCYVRQLCTSADRGVLDGDRGCFVYTDPRCSPFRSIPAAAWWAITTMTTVGYGDTYPVTPGGRVVAGVAMIAGIICVALPTTILAVEFADKYAKLMEARRNAEELRVSETLDLHELEIFDDFNKLSTIQKRMDELLPRMEYLVANQTVKLGERSHASGVTTPGSVTTQAADAIIADAYEVLCKVGGRAQKSLKDYRETVQHFIPKFCPM